MTTLFPALLMTGLALAAAPILLHLLNLQQRRPVRWAAMQFLLESRAKNQTWINLKQWLLLAARVLAVALAGLMAARPSLTSGFAAWFPGEPMHVAVLLDDSYSMSDQGGQRTPWLVATDALAALATRAAENGASRMTVVRSSRPGTRVSVATDALAGFPRTIEAWSPTEHAGGLAEGIESLISAVGETRANERVAAYVLSDFRRRDLQDAERVGRLLDRLNDASGGVTLAPCVRRRHGNLAVTDLSLVPSALVADLELTASLTVANHAASDVGRTTVRVAADGAPLPAVELEGVPAGGSVTRTFAVRFAGPGAHRLSATLPEDAVAADNDRRLAVDLPAERRVLLIDGSGGAEARVFATALRPSRATGVGWRPVRRPADSPLGSGELSSYAAVLLLDAAGLPDSTVAALQRYASDGGGVLVVLGENANRRFYNRRLFADADNPLLPVRLGVPTQTRLDDRGRAPSPQPSDHPALRALGGERSRFADLIRVRRRHALADEASTDGLLVAASLGTSPLGTSSLGNASPGVGAPLLLESIDGPGRVLCLMTSTARPSNGDEGWSNLSVSPLFPVLVNELTAYAAAPRLLPVPHRVGDSWQGIAAKQLPGATRLEQFRDDAFVTLNSGAAGLNAGPAEGSVDGSGWGGAEASGVYRLGAGGESVTVAVNVAPGEGDLSLVGDAELRRLFDGIDLRVVAADQLAGRVQQVGVTLDQRIGMLLLGLLAAEQALAYACSYHGSRAPKGAAA